MADEKLFINMNVFVFISGMASQSVFTGFIHQPPLLFSKSRLLLSCKHQFVLVAGKITTSKNTKKKKTLNPSCFYSGAAWIVLSLADHCGQNDSFFIAFSLKVFSALLGCVRHGRRGKLFVGALDWFTDQCVLKWQGGEHPLNQGSQAMKNTTSVKAACLFSHIFTHSLRGEDDREDTL